MSKPELALDFKSTSLLALRAVLYSHETSDLLQALEARMQDAGDFYKDEPIVLDASDLQEAADWVTLAKAFKAHDIHPIGVQGPEILHTSIRAAGLAVLHASDNTPVRRREPAAVPAQAATEPASETPAASSEAHASRQTTGGHGTAAASMVIRHPLRSGQRIYAANADLIVIGMVSQGAEVIADGHIHVYGPLRGKAMAGARGRTDTMILTTRLEPELLAIAGVYRVVETRLPSSVHQQAAQVLLDGETLRIRPL